MIETPLLLSRPLERHPGVDFLLVLKDPSGAITGGFHQGRRLDADQAVALHLAHRWQETGAISPSFE